jgi:hypothetical protein
MHGVRIRPANDPRLNLIRYAGKAGLSCKTGDAYAFAVLDSLACGRRRLGEGRWRAVEELGVSSISRMSLIL